MPYLRRVFGLDTDSSGHSCHQSHITDDGRDGPKSIDDEDQGIAMRQSQASTKVDQFCIDQDVEVMEWDVPDIWHLLKRGGSPDGDGQGSAGPGHTPATTVSGASPFHPATLFMDSKDLDGTPCTRYTGTPVSTVSEHSPPSRVVHFAADVDCSEDPGLWQAIDEEDLADLSPGSGSSADPSDPVEDDYDYYEEQCDEEWEERMEAEAELFAEAEEERHRQRGCSALGPGDAEWGAEEEGFKRVYVELFGVEEAEARDAVLEDEALFAVAGHHSRTPGSGLTHAERDIVRRVCEPWTSRRGKLSVTNFHEVTRRLGMYVVSRQFTSAVEEAFRRTGTIDKSEVVPLLTVEERHQGLPQVGFLAYAGCQRRRSRAGHR